MHQAGDTALSASDMRQRLPIAGDMLLRLPIEGDMSKRFRFRFHCSFRLCYLLYVGDTAPTANYQRQLQSLGNTAPIEARM